MNDAFPSNPPERKYAVFISYRHADNKEQGRQWATWLHHTLETYEVPPDLVGRTNLRGEPVPASLYPVFRDEEELPADADLSTNIQRALKHSGLLVVLCSPRAVESRFVSDEIKIFKELGKSGHILALMIDGEPNATDDPGKTRVGIRPEQECLPHPLRYGVPREDGSIDWTQRTEPIAADVRPQNQPVQGWTTAAAYREELTHQGLAKPDMDRLTTAYEEQLQLATMKIIAGAIGLPLGEVTQRDKAHQLQKQKQRTKVLRRWLAAVVILALTSFVGGLIAYKQKQTADAQTKRAIESERIANQQKQEAEAQTRRAISAEKATQAQLVETNRQKQEAEAQTRRAIDAEKATQAQLVETNRQLERSQVEEGKSWLERARAGLNKGHNLSAIMLAGRAVGYQGYGRRAQEAQSFSEAFPLLLARPMQDPTTEKERAAEAGDVSQFLDSVLPTPLPLWATVMWDRVTCIAFSSDGTRLASGSLDKTIGLWDAATGKELARLKGHASAVLSVAFSPDGSRLASGSADNTIKLWDVGSGKELASKGQSGYVLSVAFSPDGSRLAIGSETFMGKGDNTIKLWDTATGKELASLQGHTLGVNCVAFSPDGSRLASGSNDKTLKLWDVATGKELASLQGHTLGVNSVAFNPDGLRLASGSEDKTLKLWDAATGKELASLKGHTFAVSSVVFSPDGSRLASGSWDNTIKLWDAVSGKELASLQAHTSSVSSVASSIGTHLAFSTDGTHLTFSPDGSRLASGSSDQAIKLWDAAIGKELAFLKGHTSYVNTAAFSPDGSRLASGSGDKTLRLWDAATGKELASFQGHTDSVLSVAFSPDGSRLASGSFDGTAKLWDAATGKELASLQGHTSVVRIVAFSPDGTRLASSSDDDTIKLWDAATGKELASFQGHTDSVLSVAFSPDGSRLASGSFDGTAKLWDAATGKELASLQGHTSVVRIVAFSPDGTRLASSSDDDTIKLWDAATGKELASLQGHTLAVNNVAFSPDGTRLASSSEDKTIKLWDAASGKELVSVTPEELAAAKKWLAVANHRLSPDQERMVEPKGSLVFIVPNPPPTLDLTAPLRAGLLSLPGRELQLPKLKLNQTTPMLHVRQDTLAQLADPKLTPERRAELRMELCAKSSQFRAATALWQRLLQGEWPGFEGAAVPKGQAPATIPADSPIRRLYLLALIDATKHPQIHGHPTICQTAAQIGPVLTKEMMTTPTISLAMMSLMQTLAKDENPDMSVPRAALLKRFEEVATKEWLEVLRESPAK